MHNYWQLMHNYWQLLLHLYYYEKEKIKPIFISIY